MSRAYFITGTDTGVGKTSVAVALLQAAVKRGLSTAAVKPVAAGCELSSEGLRNDDALLLQQACTIALTYEQINLFALQPAIAPHFAAAREGLRLDAKGLATHCRSVLDLKADLTVVEGAGGWRVPLNDNETFADIAKLLGLPVILVVDIKLGCLNHALLSAEAIRADGLVLAGWVANQASGTNECHAEMVADLERRLACPLLGDLPHCLNQDALATHLDLDVLEIL